MPKTKTLDEVKAKLKAASEESERLDGGRIRSGYPATDTDVWRDDNGLHYSPRYSSGKWYTAPQLAKDVMCVHTLTRSEMVDVLERLGRTQTANALPDDAPERIFRLTCLSHGFDVVTVAKFDNRYLTEKGDKATKAQRRSAFKAITQLDGVVTESDEVISVQLSAPRTLCMMHPGKSGVETRKRASAIKRAEAKRAKQIKESEAEYQQHIAEVKARVAKRDADLESVRESLTGVPSEYEADMKQRRIEAGLQEPDAEMNEASTIARNSDDRTEIESAEIRYETARTAKYAAQRNAKPETVVETPKPRNTPQNAKPRRVTAQAVSNDYAPIEAKRDIAIVCGGRHFADRQFMFDTLDQLARQRGKFDIVTGGGRGADNLADEYAGMRGVDLRVFGADWIRYGRSAGPRRNADMIAQSGAVLCIAFAGGRGTADIVRRARKAGIEVLEPRNDQPAKPAKPVEVDAKILAQVSHAMRAKQESTVYDVYMPTTNGRHKQTAGKESQ